MTAHLTSQNSLPHKDCRGWLIVFGIIEILIAAIFLLVLALIALVLIFPHLGESAGPPQSSAQQSGALVAGILVYGCAAATFLIIGIGSIRCRNWARIAIQVVSGFWLATGVISTLAVVLVLPSVVRQQATSNKQIQTGVLVVMTILMTLIMIAMPLVLLIFYSHKNVKATCLSRSVKRAATASAVSGPIQTIPVISILTSAVTAGSYSAEPHTAPNPPGSRVPAPLVILAIWQGLGISAPLGLLFAKSIFLFGMILHGPSAVAYSLCIAALSGYAAWSTFKQRVIGWEIGLYTAIFGTASYVTTFAGHDPMQILQRMGLVESQLQVFHQFPQMGTLIWISSLAGSCAYFAFLTYTRRFFPDPTRPETQEPVWRP